MAQVIDFPHGLVFHTEQKKSAFVKQLKKIFKNIGVTFEDECCSDSFRVSKVNVTQATSKTTAVTANALAGVITTVALTDAADTSFSFTLNNDKILSSSVINLQAQNAGNGLAVLQVSSIADGSAVIKVTNAGTAAFNSLIKIHFTIN